jgi:tRNA/rRNA methyltransferase/tRNA (cytidine32/uridine32-2'-O)-methyltransferase
MKNMGLSRLRLVSPGALDEGVIRARAVHAGELWERAESFDSLAPAIAGCALVIGTTRRRGQRRKALTLTPKETAEYLRDRSGPAALVFGNERTGLEGPELALCNLASHIPSDRAFPSLNLSHAVQIYGYELFSLLDRGEFPAYRGHRDGNTGGVPLDRTALDALVGSISGSLASLGFYKQPGREEQEEFFRDILARAGLTLREGRYLGDIFAKAARLGGGLKTGGNPGFGPLIPT